MKNLYCFAVLASLFILFSCGNKDLDIRFQGDDIENVTVVIDEMVCEDIPSRLVPNEDVSKYAFEKGDKFGVFPTKGAQLEFPISDEDEGGSKVHFDGGGWAMKRNTTYTIYYPFNFYNRNANAVPFSYIGQEQNGNDNREHLRKFLFVASAPTETNETSITFGVLHQGSIMKLELTMPEAKIWSSLSVYTDSEVLPVEKTFDLLSASLEQTVVSYSDRITIGLKNIETTASNEKIIVWIAFPSASESTHPLKVSVRDSEGYAYVANITKTDGTQAFASFTAHKWQPRYASPVLQQGINSGISDWEKSDKDYGGTVGG